MNYKSPIEAIWKEAQLRFEDGVYQAVQGVDIHVDRDELIKALQYDRQQYEKGWHDALLKEQEARVLTLEEVNALKFDDVVYVEVVPTHAVLSAIVIDVIPKVPDIDIGVVQFRYAPTWNGIENADLTYYGKTWRCWNARPTDEQKKAVKWDG